MKAKLHKNKYFVGTKKLKHVKMFEGFLFESKETEFAIENAENLKTAIKNLKIASDSVRTLFETLPEETVIEALKKADESIKNYEKNIPNFIDRWINTNSFHTDAKDIIELAFKNEIQYGTEPHFVIKAINDWCAAFMKEVKKIK